MQDHRLADAGQLVGWRQRLLDILAVEQDTPLVKHQNQPLLRQPEMKNRTKCMGARLGVNELITHNTTTSILRTDLGLDDRRPL